MYKGKRLPASLMSAFTGKWNNQRSMYFPAYKKRPVTGAPRFYPPNAQAYAPPNTVLPLSPKIAFFDSSSISANWTSSSVLFKQ